MTYSGSGNVTAQLQEVNDNQFPPGPTPSSSNAGCEAADFAGFVPGRVALIQRGTCPFHDKALNAQTAGASAVVIFNEGQPGRTDAIAGHARHARLPHPGHRHVVRDRAGAAHAARQRPGDRARQDLDRVRDPPDGERPRRDAVGRSEPRHRPGLAPRLGRARARASTTTAPGSAYNLESAIQVMKNHIKTKNKIRFAWWGAEEFNLLGSQFYVDSLSDEEFAKIMREPQLRHDRVAELRALRLRRRRLRHRRPQARTGRREIEQIFVDWFDSQGLASEPTAFDGRSDYGPFIARGAPGRRAVHRRRGREDGRSRPRCTAASPARPTTAATTRPATRSAT